MGEITDVYFFCGTSDKGGTDCTKVFCMVEGWLSCLSFVSYSFEFSSKRDNKLSWKLLSMGIHRFDLFVSVHFIHNGNKLPRCISPLVSFSVRTVFSINSSKQSSCTTCPHLALNTFSFFERVLNFSKHKQHSSLTYRFLGIPFCPSLLMFVFAVCVFAKSLDKDKFSLEIPSAMGRGGGGLFGDG